MMQCKRGEKSLNKTCKTKGAYYVSSNSEKHGDRMKSLMLLLKLYHLSANDVLNFNTILTNGRNSKNGV